MVSVRFVLADAVKTVHCAGTGRFFAGMINEMLTWLFHDKRQR